MIYFIASTRAKDIHFQKLTPDKLPSLTVVIPTYNEEDVIVNRLRNLAEIDYPKEKMEILIIDDMSTDRTVQVAEHALKENNLNGKVLVKERRTGPNSSLNLGVEMAKSSIIIHTDADVEFELKAITAAVSLLLSDDAIGAVTGELIPATPHKTMVSQTEGPYRAFYGKICTWESQIHSTYNFNGPFMVYKRSAWSPIPEEKGATDANLAMQVIKNGYRAVYLRSAGFIEVIPHKLSEHKKQKLRRAIRLLQTTIFNLSVIGKHEGFGRVVFPLRMCMLIFSPTFLFAGMSLVLSAFLLYNMLLFLLLMVLLIIMLLISRFIPNIFISFLYQNIYLFTGLLLLFTKKPNWEPVHRDAPP